MEKIERCEDDYYCWVCPLCDDVMSSEVFGFEVGEVVECENCGDTFEIV